MYTVTISERGKPPVKLDFDKPEITIGRVRGNDIVLQKNNVSKRHAKLVVKDEQFIIIDQKSTNGTIVNARKITAPQVVREDDKICIGDFILTLRTTEDEQAVPPPAPPSAVAGPPPAPPAPPVMPPTPAGPPSPPLAVEAPRPSAPIPSGTVPPGPPPAAGPSPAGPSPPPGVAPPAGRAGTAQAPSGPRLSPMPPPGGPPVGALTTPGKPVTGQRGAPPQIGPPSQSQPQGLGSPGASNPSVAVDSRGPTAEAPAFSREREPPVAATVSPGAPPQALSELADMPPPAAPQHQPMRSTMSGVGPTADAPAPPPSMLASPVGASKAASAPIEAAAPKSKTADMPKPHIAPSVPMTSAAPSPVLSTHVKRAHRPNIAVGIGAGTQNEVFTQAQVQALAKIFERTTAEDLPAGYPPEQADLAEHERSVDRILDSVAAGGQLDGVDRGLLMSLLTFELVGLGPLELLLDDPTITEAVISGPGRTSVTRDGVSRPGGPSFGSPTTMALAVNRLLSIAQMKDNCFATVRFADGSRIDLLLPPVAAFGPVISLRKRPTSFRSLQELIQGEVMSGAMATFVRQAVHAHRTILIAGPRGSGKTEMLHALGSTIADGERLVTIEETAALRLPQISVVALETVDLPTGTSAVGYATRLGPERILLDELGPHDTYDWILAVNASAMGSIATITAHGARDALARTEGLAIPATPLYSVRGIREQIGRSVHFVLVLSGGGGEPSRITQIIEVQGLELDTLRLQDVFYHQAGGADTGSFHPTGHVPAFYEELRRGGVPTDLAIFRT